MPTKPVSLPVWNTDATNRTTPSGGKQAAGFSLNEAPSSSFQNWWQNLVYQWVNYLNAPLGVATTPALTATAGTGAGSVALRLEAGDASSIPLYCLAQGAAAGLAPLVAGFPGTSAIFATGQTGLPGALFCNVAVGPGAWATTANPGSTGFYGTGVAGSSGGMFVGNGINIATLVALAIGAGAGGMSSSVAGLYGNGVGVSGVRAAVETSSPVRGALALDPQILPSAPVKGNVWIDTATGFLRHYDGTRKRGLMYEAIISGPSTTLSNFTAYTTFSTGAFTIPANLLEVGSIIEVEWGVAGSFATTGNNFFMRVEFGGQAVGQDASLTATSGSGVGFNNRGKTQIQLKTVGATATSRGVQDHSSQIHTVSAGNYAADNMHTSVNSTGALSLNLRAAFSAANANNTAQLVYAIVRVY